MIALGSPPVASTPADRKGAGQQGNVYAAEATLDHGRTFDISTAQEFVDSLTSSDWWFAPKIRRVEVTDIKSKVVCGLGRNEEENGAGVIGLTGDGLNALTILHEVAHCITHKQGGHGPEWVQNYMKLVYYVMEAKAYPALHAAFKKNGVMFD